MRKLLEQRLIKRNGREVPVLFEGRARYERVCLEGLDYFLLETTARDYIQPGADIWTQQRRLDSVRQTKLQLDLKAYRTQHSERVL